MDVDKAGPSAHMRQRVTVVILPVDLSFCRSICLSISGSVDIGSLPALGFKPRVKYEIKLKNTVSSFRFVFEKN